MELKFEGYWREVNNDDIPNKAGIYLVYRCTKTETGVSIKDLIYIGESDNVQERISGHEKKSKCWNKKLKSGEVLCYSFAPIAGSDKDRAEAALIFKHKPSCNEEYVDNFPYEQTTVKSSGRCKYITPSFTVSKTT